MARTIDGLERDLAEVERKLVGLVRDMNRPTPPQYRVDLSRHRDRPTREELDGLARTLAVTGFGMGAGHDVTGSPTGAAVGGAAAFAWYRWLERR